jgi:hypothetical protein
MSKPLVLGLTVVLAGSSACEAEPAATGSKPQPPARAEPAPVDGAQPQAGKADTPAPVADAPAQALPAKQAQPEPTKPEPTEPEPTETEPTEPEPVADAPKSVEPVPIVKAEPVATQVAWRSVSSPAHTVTFEPLTRGVLGRSDGGYYDVDENAALVLRPEIQAPKGPVLGVWPDNAWFIDRRTKTDPRDRSAEEIDQVRLMRLRGERRWVPQMYEGEQRFVDEGHRFVVGAKGGMLVAFAGEVSRVAGTAPDPDQGVHKGGELLGVFESRSGRLYSAREVGDTIFVQGECFDDACVTQSATPMPLGSLWSFGRPVPRARHSISVVAKVRHEGESVVHVLHYGAGAWKLDQLEEAPSGLWPATDGGLWVQTEDALLHRSPTGTWQAIGLPAGASGVSVAMRKDQSEVWVAATVGGKAEVFATPSVLPPEEAAAQP